MKPESQDYWCRHFNSPLKIIGLVLISGVLGKHPAGDFGYKPNSRPQLLPARLQLPYGLCMTVE